MDLWKKNIPQKILLLLAVLAIAVSLSMFSRTAVFSGLYNGMHCRVRAMMGDAQEQYRLGVMYSMGIDVGKDPAQACRWFKRAAMSGHAPAAYLAGLMYAEGKDIAQDNAEAVKWYKMAAEKNFTPAQAALGRMYTQGLGVKKDIAEGLKWKKRAAEQGSASAIYDMGLMYYKGEFVERDKGEAIRWFTAGAEIGDYRSQYYLGMIKLGDGYISEAIDLITRAAEKNYPEALFSLGMMRLTGQGMAADPVKAYSLFEKAALKGHAEAMYNIGMMEFLGVGTARDMKKAFGHFGKANGHREAMYMKGLMLRDGLGCAADAAKAAKYFKDAAELDLPEARREYGRYLYETIKDGSKAQDAFKQAEMASKKLDAEAFILMGMMAERGNAPGRAKDAAVKYYAAASLLGSAKASFMLGEKYEMGEGVRQDISKAIYYYELSSAQAPRGNRAVIPSAASSAGNAPDIKNPVWSYDTPPDIEYGAMARYALGIIYYYGKGVPENKSKGMALISEAARSGYPEAMKTLGPLK